jgi:hypothetical protein
MFLRRCFSYRVPGLYSFIIPNYCQNEVLTQICQKQNPAPLNSIVRAPRIQASNSYLHYKLVIDPYARLLSLVLVVFLCPQVPHTSSFSTSTRELPLNVWNHWLVQRDNPWRKRRRVRMQQQPRLAFDFTGEISMSPNKMTTTRPNLITGPS